MVISRHQQDQAPVEVEFAPHGAHRLLPLEVLLRSELLQRTSELAHRQRVGFHQLIVCTEGQGTHWVDFEPHPISPGTVLRTHPGQVQSFVTEPSFEAQMVIWPFESHPATPGGSLWYPGGTIPTRWHLDNATLLKVLGWIDELRLEQQRFVGSAAHTRLMAVLLHALLIRLAIEIPDSEPDVSHLPRPYLAFRGLVEQRLHDRPSVAIIAHDLGYSTRTLDRACDLAAGRTAKQLLDERIALEIRRLLTHTTRPIASIGFEFGFKDPSNFSKFVKANLGAPPGQIRRWPDGRTNPDRERVES